MDYRFPPKIFYVIIWVLTFIITVCILIFTEPNFWSNLVYGLFSLAAIYQLWQVIWVKFDDNKITVTNIFGMKTVADWNTLSSYKLEEIHLRKNNFQILKLFSNLNNTKNIIKITSDQVGFDTLLTVVKSRLKAT